MRPHTALFPHFKKRKKRWQKAYIYLRKRHLFIKLSVKFFTNHDKLIINPHPPQGEFNICVRSRIIIIMVSEFFPKNTTFIKLYHDFKCGVQWSRTPKKWPHCAGCGRTLKSRVRLISITDVLPSLRSTEIHHCKPTEYYYSGFLGLQILIDYTWIEVRFANKNFLHSLRALHNTTKHEFYCNS